MRNLKLFIFFLALTAISSCENKNDSCPACGYKDPSQEIPWIKSSIMAYNSQSQKSLYKIDLYENNGQQLIIYSWTNKEAYDLPSGAIYDCSGNLMYLCGGNQPFDSCSYIITKSKYIGNIWTK